MTIDRDVIAAVATPAGLSALAVVRLSGQGSAALVEVLAGIPDGRLQGMRRALVSIPGAGEVVALGWPAGKSYTGEEMVELMCHGIPEQVTALMLALLNAGARSALPGEFTGRAWRNGVMSDSQVMALAAAVETGRIVTPLEDVLHDLQINVSSALEAVEGCIEFQEEAFANSKDLEAAIEKALLSAGRLMECTHSLQRAARVFLMGNVNAGKSTLFNALCGERVALVDPSPGTTRDGARSEISVGGRRLLLIDTPGFGGDGIDRDALDTVLLGISREDTLVWLSPDGEDIPAILKSASGRIITVLSKSDMHELPGLRVSSVTGEGTDTLRRMLAEMTSTSGEHRVMEIHSLVKEAVEAVCHDPGIAADLLREAESIASEMTGIRQDLNAVERALGVLCVGK